MYSHLCLRMGSVGGSQSWTSGRKSSSPTANFRTASNFDLNFGGVGSGGWPFFVWTCSGRGNLGGWLSDSVCRDTKSVSRDFESVIPCDFEAVSRDSDNDSRDLMILAIIFLTSSGVFFSHFVSSSIKMEMTWIGRTISGVLLRSRGGSSPIMIAVADVFPLPAVPNSNTLDTKVTVWP